MVREVYNICPYFIYYGRFKENSMPLDVDKISEGAAKIAGDAATAINEMAEQAEPLVKSASKRVDELAEKGRPYVERMERQAKDAVESVLGRERD